LRRSYAVSFWDSLVIASALQAQVSVLYSEDLQHEQVIDGRLRIINPFVN
jgi:predicted nucleic acid-binding protein